MSQKGHNDGIVSAAGLSTKELRRLYEGDAPVVAIEFARSAVSEWAPPHSHVRGQLFALTKGLLIVDAAGGRWMFPSQRCAWIPPNCVHAARSVGGATGSMLFLSPHLSRGLPPEPRLLASSELLFSIVNRIIGWSPSQPLSGSQNRLLAVLRDEIRRPVEQFLRLPIPKREKPAKVARALLENVADDRTLDEWARYVGMSRRTFMRAFSAEMQMPFGRWRQQARLFAALERLARQESVTDVAMAVGYDSVSAFIDMFRVTLGATPRAYFGGKEKVRQRLQPESDAATPNRFGTSAVPKPKKRERREPYRRRPARSLAKHPSKS
jgi:AraC-like DNA-binding protein